MKRNAFLKLALIGFLVVDHGPVRSAFTANLDLCQHIQRGRA